MEGAEGGALTPRHRFRQLLASWLRSGHTTSLLASVTEKEEVRDWRGGIAQCAVVVVRCSLLACRHPGIQGLVCTRAADHKQHARRFDDSCVSCVRAVCELLVGSSGQASQWPAVASSAVVGELGAELLSCMIVCTSLSSELVGSYGTAHKGKLVVVSDSVIALLPPRCMYCSDISNIPVKSSYSKVGKVGEVRLVLSSRCCRPHSPAAEARLPLLPLANHTSTRKFQPAPQRISGMN